MQPGKRGVFRNQHATGKGTKARRHGTTQTTSQTGSESQQDDRSTRRTTTTNNDQGRPTRVGSRCTSGSEG
jgi:hypothetical protein